MKELRWCQAKDVESSIIRVPLLFNFPTVETLTKELTKLNSPHPYRIIYLGSRWDNSINFHKKYSINGAYEFKNIQIGKNHNLLYVYEK